jgi:hypothetical protein
VSDFDASVDAAGLVGSDGCDCGCGCGCESGEGEGEGERLDAFVESEVDAVGDESDATFFCDDSRFSSQAIQLHHLSKSRRSADQEHRDNLQTTIVIEDNIEVGTNLLVPDRKDH